jgi:hypothetical protein
MVKAPARPRSSAAALLLAFLVLGLVLAPRAHGFLYWSNPGSIGRVNLDTTGLSHNFITGTMGTCGVAVDGAHVYWANESPGSIGRANLDGTGAEENFITAAGTSPCGVAVDGQHIYWTNETGGGAIGRANLDGTDANPSFITGAGTSVSGVAADGTHLYWSHGSAIGRADLDGGNANPNFLPPASYLPPDASLPPGYGYPNGVAVDGAHLYWSHPYGIGRAGLDGTGANPGLIETSADGLAVHGGYVYWVVVTHPAKGFTSWGIGRARLDGSCVDHGFVPAAFPLPVRGLAADAGGPQAPDPPPPNDYDFGKVKKNTERGTAKLTVLLPGPGRVSLAETRKLEPAAKIAEAGGKQRLRVKPKRNLPEPGEKTVNAKITFIPTAGCPNTETRKVELVRR